MVDWGLARQIAGLAAGSSRVPDLGLDLAGLARDLEAPVIGYTALVPARPVPAAEVLSRDGWARANLQTMEELLEPVTSRLEDRLRRAGPLAGPLRLGMGAVLAAEVGLVTGFLSRHVLGQYELSLLAPAVQPRLLLVGENLEAAHLMLRADRESFLRWVVVHELVHAVQFGGVPWLRDHLGGLLRRYLETVDVQPAPGAARALPRLPDPAALAARFREGGLAALVQSGEQREIMEAVQAAMAVVEGHAEHVMDALASDVVPHHEGLRDAMEQRRTQRSAPQRVLMRLLGMEMKMRQYREGKAFCDAVVTEGGMELLNRVWTGPAALPTPLELREPGRWTERVTPSARTPSA